jgi:hypothetical protein
VIRRDVWEQQTSAQPHFGERPKPAFVYGAWADQARIGTLTPEGEDTWWRIVRGRQSGIVRDDAMHDLLNYGVPWLRERIG